VTKDEALKRLRKIEANTHDPFVTGMIKLITDGYEVDDVLSDGIAAMAGAMTVNVDELLESRETIDRIRRGEFADL